MNRLLERNTEISRLEGFSDAVFAFAITLLIVSLEVPRNFDALLDTMRQFGVFAICFAMLAYIWHVQYTFFRRYGLEDTPTVILNLILLFLVLFYVYPLKFLFGIALTGAGVEMIRPEQEPLLFIIYGLGFAAIFFVYACLYAHAYRLRAALGLGPAQELEARASIVQQAVYVCVGLLSVVIAITGIGDSFGLAGWCYFLVGVYGVVAGAVVGRRKRRLTENSNVDAKMDRHPRVEREHS